VSYLFYPGCSLHGTAWDFNESTRQVIKALDLQMPEIKDWICCGSTAAHSTDPLLADALPAKSLSNAGGATVAVACAACYSRLKTANHHIAGDTAVRARVARVVGSDYDGRTPVRHLLEDLAGAELAQFLVGGITQLWPLVENLAHSGRWIGQPSTQQGFHDNQTKQHANRACFFHLSSEKFRQVQ